MNKILLFGGTGNLGKQIAREACNQGYNVTAVVRNSAKTRDLENLAHRFIIADVTKPDNLVDICAGFDVVISSLGKSVSPAERSKTTFNDVDLIANLNILKEALTAGIKKFVYVSALHSERYIHLEYFRVHHEFSEKLKHSGLDYSIIKPPAIFSAYRDAVDMARKGRLVHLGKGTKKTNPIYEGDLANVCVDSIKLSRGEIEAGGKQILTRRQINELIQQRVNPSKKVPTIPPTAMKIMLPLIKVFDRNLYDKFAFFAEVLQHDILAPQIGPMTFSEYLSLEAR